MRDRLRKRIRAAISGPSPTSDAARIAGLDVHALRPGSASGAPITKVGRLSLVGELPDGTRVKIVEAHGPQHAQFQALVASGPLAELVPPVLGVEGTLVVSAWVEQDPGARPPDVTVLVALLAAIHRIPVPAADAGFDAWADHVLPRARRAARALGCTPKLEGLLRPALELAGSTRVFVLHPDLTPDNVIAARSGRPVVIDNELLGVGRTPWLDVANLARGADRDRDRVLDTYREAGGDALDADALPGVRAMWTARLLGTFFVAGRLGAAHALLGADAHERRLPFER